MINLSTKNNSNNAALFTGKLEEQKGGLVADACRKTIRTLMKNSVENVENQILSILEDVGAKMAPTIERFLFEGQVCTKQQHLLSFFWCTQTGKW